MEISDLLVFFAMVSFGILSIIPLTRKNRKNYNPINSAFIRMIIAILILESMRFFVLFLEFDDIFVIGYELRLTYILGFAVIMVRFLFFFYLQHWSYHYALPIIWWIFTLVSLAEINNQMIRAVNSTILPILLIIFFLRKGVKNRDGNIFAIGLFELSFTIGAMFIYSPISVFSEMFIFMVVTLGFILLNLGTWDILVKAIFYDKEREKKIKSAWISQMIQVPTGRQKQVQVAAVVQEAIARVHLECPICGADKRHVLSPKFVRDRKTNPKGIVRMLVDEGTICDHAFIAYLDRGFKARGYDTVDMVA